MSYRKYNAQRTHIPELNRTFASKAEAERGLFLWKREQRGEIRDLRCQPAFELGARRKFVLDFDYWELTDGFDLWVIEDVKGKETPEFKLKLDWMSVALPQAYSFVRVVKRRYSKRTGVYWESYCVSGPKRIHWRTEFDQA